VLLDQLKIVGLLLGRVEDPTVPAAQLARLAESLERLDDRRDHLIRALREEATEIRKREEERSVRQFVLRALDELMAPQNAGFLQEYVWAREGVDLNTRGFGALRRDERRSWHRNPGRRLAYIVPALDKDGYALARLMARSDWPLERRITVVGTGERLLDLYKLRTLLEAIEREEKFEPGDPYVPLIERYARELFDVGVVPADDATSREKWFAELQVRTEVESASLAKSVAAAKQAAAQHLETKPEEQQLWGISRSARSASDIPTKGGL
jgi:hypothetical protein